MNKRLKSILIILVVVVAIFGFFKIATFLGSGEKAQSEKPLVICQPQGAPLEQQKCFWTAHLHARITPPVGFEKGNIDGVHTHAEPNFLHWHGLIPVERGTTITEFNPDVFARETVTRDLGISAQSIEEIIHE